MTTEEYIALYYAPGTQKVGSQILAKDITRLNLQIILATIQRIVGSTSSHQISIVHMYYVVRCIDSTIFDWSSTLLGCLKAELTSCRRGKTGNFGFGNILYFFFFERVPSLSPRVPVGPHSLTIPAMGRWTFLMLRLGGGRAPSPFDDDFYSCWSRQVIAIKDYPYAGSRCVGSMDSLLQENGHPRDTLSPELGSWRPIMAY